MPMASFWPPRVAPASLCLLISGASLSRQRAALALAHIRVLGRADNVEQWMALGPRLFEHLKKQLGGLRARDAVALIHDKERNAVDAEHPRPSLIRAYGVSVGVTLEGGAHLIGVEPSLSRQANQRLGLADVLALAEVGGHHPLQYRVLQALAGGEVNQAMRLDG